MLTLNLPDETATRNLGVVLGRSLPPGSILLLEGNLGSGKTTLVQGMGEGLGIVEPVSSPTFILLNEYPEGRIPLYHFDLYRLSPQEVNDLHLETYWEGLEFPLGIVAIEWAERLAYLPQDYLQIHLSPLEAGRTAQLTAYGSLISVLKNLNLM
ncbi:MAG: tRNA (adenosine(37)-N6)-threonylcarbamoyltransferase complex ATPase subunit type 1 TsaE [Oculatellaceae cyanobacterium Prado106]|jgi:tRNA threonylcarbamoyladenosine biosynthesis protein TsaE|nr:tRNA (adenosine(37)-N6)-threonylcarbamoyltransferase complex ATPase subunit type 1 TsaE [Oculatellaceae cyanobacterium Prado106]